MLVQDDKNKTVIPAKAGTQFYCGQTANGARAYLQPAAFFWFASSDFMWSAALGNSVSSLTKVVQATCF